MFLNILPVTLSGWHVFSNQTKNNPKIKSDLPHNESKNLQPNQQKLVLIHRHRYTLLFMLDNKGGFTYPKSEGHFTEIYFQTDTLHSISIVMECILWNRYWFILCNCEMKWSDEHFTQSKISNCVFWRLFTMWQQEQHFIILMSSWNGLCT